MRRAAARARRARAARRRDRARSRAACRATHQLEFENALVMIAIVVALYVFVGNSGVISFGHVSFVAVGAYLAGILTVDPETKTFTMPGLFPVLRHAHIGTVPSLALAAVAGGVYALAVGLPLMRLSGLPAGHRDLRGARDHVQRPLLLAEDRPGARRRCPTFPRAGAGRSRPARSSPSSSRTRTSAAGSGACCARRARIPQRRARPASRSIASAWSASRVSGALAGLAGGLYVHQLGLITPDLFYLDLTFVTLAMLVFGGVGSLWGAVRRRARDQRAQLVPRRRREHRARRLPARRCRTGTRLVTIGAVMALVLILRPSGLTGGREFGLEARVTSVCVAGAGTIGSLLAAHLARVADVSVLTRREEHAAALERARPAGLGPRRLHRRASRRRPIPPTLRRRPRDRRVQGQRRSSRSPQRLAGQFAGATVMTVQNGLGAEEIVGAHGAWPLLSVGHVHERHAARRHARRVHPRHGDLDRPVPRHDAADARAVADADRLVGPEGGGVRRPAPCAVVEADLQRDGQRASPR